MTLKKAIQTQRLSLQSKDERFFFLDQQTGRKLPLTYKQFNHLINKTNEQKGKAKTDIQESC